MTFHQILSFAVIALMMAAFVWGRFRYDLVAAWAPARRVAIGVVPPTQAFTGFSDDIVIIVGSRAPGQRRRRAVRHHGGGDLALRPRRASGVAHPARRAGRRRHVLSAFVKNIGALAIMIPIAFQFARRSDSRLRPS